MTVPSISCPFCGITMQAVWYREKELDAHGIPTGRICANYSCKALHFSCSCLLCDSCGYRETVDNSFDESYK